MTLSRKLLALLALALASFIAVLAVCSFGIRNVYQAANYGNENIAPSLQLLNGVTVDFAHARTRVYRFAMAGGQSAKDELAQEIRSTLSKTSQELRGYDKLVSDEKDKAFLQKDLELLASYAPAVEKLLAAAEPAAIQAALDAAGEIAHRLNSALGEHIQYNIELGRRMAEQAQDTEKSTSAQAIAIILASMAILAGAILHIRSGMDRSLAQALELANKVAAGDLRANTSSAAAGADEIGRLNAALESMRADLAATVRSIAQSSLTLVQTSDKLSAEATRANHSIQAQTSATAGAAAAVEQLTVSIDHVGNSSADADGLARAAGERAGESARNVADASGKIQRVSEQVEQTSVQIKSLSNQVLEIGNITQVIKDLAEQTNLLALNAAIEAARAGEQGRGFAVVADEVRKLAEKTANSVQDISGVIQNIQSGVAATTESMESSRLAVQDVVRAAGAANESMALISGSTASAGKAISDISDALREQRSASTDLARNVESIAAMSDENLATIQSVSQTAGDLHALAANLEHAVHKFTV